MKQDKLALVHPIVAAYVKAIPPQGQKTEYEIEAELVENDARRAELREKRQAKIERRLRAWSGTYVRAA